MRPEVIKATIRKIVCEGYRGTCEDILEQEDEELHSSVYNSALNGAKGHRPRDSQFLKENNPMDRNIAVKTEGDKRNNAKSPRYLSPNTDNNVKMVDTKEVYGPKKGVLRLRDERQVQSIDVNIHNINVDLGFTNQNRSMSNPALDTKSEDTPQDVKNNRGCKEASSRWIDLRIQKNNAQSLMTNPKNDDMNRLRKKARNFELNKLFKRTLNATTQSFYRNKNKSELRFENKTSSELNDSKGVNRLKVAQNKVGMTFMESLKSRPVDLKSFEYLFDNNRSLKSLTVKDTSKSKSRDSACRRLI